MAAFSMPFIGDSSTVTEPIVINLKRSKLFLLLITFTDRFYEVHREFHIWNGGTKAPCTVDDLIQFVIERYPDQKKPY